MKSSGFASVSAGSPRTMKPIIALTFAGSGRGFFGSREPDASRGGFSGIGTALLRIAERYRAREIPNHAAATVLFADAATHPCRVLSYLFPFAIVTGVTCHTL